MQSSARLTEAVGSDQWPRFREADRLISSSVMSDMLDHAVRQGSMELLEILLSTNPPPDRVWKAESTMAELGRWDMLELHSSQWHNAHHQEYNPAVALYAIGIHEGLGRGGHVAQIQVLVERNGRDRMRHCDDHYNFAASHVAVGAATVGNLALIRELADLVIPAMRTSVLRQLVEYGHCAQLIEFWEHRTWGVPADDPEAQIARLQSPDAVARLAMRRQWDAAESLLAHDGMKPDLMKLVKSKDLVAVKWFLRKWPNEANMDHVVEAMIRDQPEMVSELMPHATRDRLDALFMFQRWRWFIARTNIRNFMRWASFLYRLFPMGEWCALRFFNELMPSIGPDPQPIRDELRRIDKQYAVDWIDLHWTKENKNRVEAMDKWWIRVQDEQQ
jgi:hypothetical protein